MTQTHGKPASIKHSGSWLSRAHMFWEKDGSKIPKCEFCELPAGINTPRLDGDIENNPYIDLCLSCDKKYQGNFGLNGEMGNDQQFGY